MSYPPSALFHFFILQFFYSLFLPSLRGANVAHGEATRVLRTASVAHGKCCLISHSQDSSELLREIATSASFYSTSSQ